VHDDTHEITSVNKCQEAKPAAAHPLWVEKYQ